MLRLRKKKTRVDSIEAYAVCHCPTAACPCQCPCDPGYIIYALDSPSKSEMTAFQLMADIQYGI